MNNPLIPTPFDVVMLALSYAAALAAAIGALTVLWILVVPKRRRQLGLLLLGRDERNHGDG